MSLVPQSLDTLRAILFLRFHGHLFPQLECIDEAQHHQRFCRQIQTHLHIMVQYSTSHDHIDHDHHFAFYVYLLLPLCHESFLDMGYKEFLISHVPHIYVPFFVGYVLNEHHPYNALAFGDLLHLLLLHR